MSSDTFTINRRYDMCIRRLKTLCAKAAHSGNGNAAAEVDADLVLEVAAELQLLLPHVDTGALACSWFVLGKGHLASLVSLFSLALRRSVPGGSETAANPAERDAFAALRSALVNHLARLPYSALHEIYGYETDLRNVMKVSDALVGCQTLPCFLAVLAGSAAELTHQMASQEAQGQPWDQHEHLQPRRYPAAVAAVLSILDETCTLLEVLACKQRGCTRYRDSIVLVVDTSLLEHWARALLQLLLLAPQRGNVQEEAARLLSRMGPFLSSEGRLFFEYRLGEPPASLSYLFSSLLVQLAAALDGGTTYGMPPAAATPLPLRQQTRDSLQQQRASSEGPYVDTRTALVALEAWRRKVLSLRHTATISVFDKHGAHPFLRDQVVHPFGSARTACRRALECCREQLREVDDAIGFRNDGRLEVRLVGLNYVREDYTHHVKCFEELVQSRSLGVPPLNLAAAREVSMRLAAAALRVLAPSAAVELRQQSASVSSSPWLSHPSQQQQEQQQQVRLGEQQQPRQQQLVEGFPTGDPAELGQRLRLHPAEAVPLGLKALRCAREALWDVGWAPPEQTPAPKADQLYEFWGWASELIHGAARRDPQADGGMWKWSDLSRLFELRLDYTKGGWSADLVIAVLEQGYLRLLELVLRRSGTFEGWGSSICASAFGPAILLGPDLEACALLSTMAKILRRADIGFGDALAAEVVAVAAATDAPASLRAIADQAAREARSRVVDRAEAAEALLRFVETLADPVPQLQWLKDCLSLVAAYTASQDAARADEAAVGGRPAGAGAQGDRNQCLEMKALCARHGARLSLTAVLLLPAVSQLTLRLTHDSSLDTLKTHNRVLLSWTHPLAAAAAAAAADAEANDGAAVFWQERLEAECRPGAEDRREMSAAAAAAAAAAADSAKEAAQWDRLLWEELNLPSHLGLGMWVLERVRDDLRNDESYTVWRGAMWVLVDLAPRRLAASLMPTQKGDAPKEAQSGSRIMAFSLTRMRQLLGPDGKLPDPQLLDELERICTATAVGVAGAGLRGSTAVQRHAGSGGTADPKDPLAARRLLPYERSLAAVLVPPGEVRALVPVCGNPLCTSLAGDSEAGQRLSGCGRCGGRVRYCCRECQVAHWKAGHKVECDGAASAGAVHARTHPTGKS